ncbi:MAG: DNA polymerase III subunit chi [Methylococcaceae bacterium]|jgi:DNA polymerase-3 subunit chi
MPEVSFYVLNTRSAQERLVFVCKLVEKAYRSGHFCYVLTDDLEQSQQLDDLLWSFRPGSFIPHLIYAGITPDPMNRVLIGQLPAPDGWQLTQINLSNDCPSHFLQTQRILEILDENGAIKVAGRQRYRAYQQAGIEPLTHKL